MSDLGFTFSMTFQKSKAQPLSFKRVFIHESWVSIKRIRMQASEWDFCKKLKKFTIFSKCKLWNSKFF